MGLFKAIKNTYKKSEAAVIVQNLLEKQHSDGFFRMDPSSSATSLVDAVWQKTPHLFNGHFGQRPHKLSVAAMAFANAIDVLKTEESNKTVFALCLGQILDEVQVNGDLFPFNGLDRKLQETALSTFMQHSESLPDLAFEVDQAETSENQQEADLDEAALNEIKNLTRCLGLELTPHGFGVALLSLASGYTPAETVSHLATITFARDMKAAGHDIIKIMALAPRGYATLEYLKKLADKQCIRAEIWQNDAAAIINIIDQSSETKAWIDRVLSDPIASSEAVAVSHI